VLGIEPKPYYLD